MRVTFCTTVQGRQTAERLYQAGESAEIEDTAACDLIQRGLAVAVVAEEAPRPQRKKKEAVCELP